MATTRYLVTESGNGTALTEANLRVYNAALSGQASFVVNGYRLVDDGGGLTIDVKNGLAVVNGYVIDQTMNKNNQSLTGSSTNYVWLEPDGDLEIETTGTPTDSNALLIGTVTTDGSGVTDVTHKHAITNSLNVCIYKETNQTEGGASADDELTFTANPGEIWDLKAVLIVTSDTTSDFEAGFRIPSGFLTGATYGPSDDDTSSTVFSGATDTDESHSSASVQRIEVNTATQSNGVIMLRGLAIIGDTGGACRVEWGYRVSPNSPTVNAGSYLIARRVRG